MILNNGVEMPVLGLGVFQLKEGKEVKNAVVTAFRNGYRRIDTAAAYHNEEGVGRGIRESGIKREELFVTSKVANTQQGYKETIKAFYKSLKELRTDYLDLYLIHWPRGDDSIGTWKAMEELYQKGLIRAIGVSNYAIHHLDYFLPKCEVIPAVNQVEFHPQLSHPDLLEYCREKNIQLESWSPLMRGHALQIPEIQAMAVKYEKTAAQIIIRWILQKGVLVIPRSGTEERIISNSQVFDFCLDDKDVEVIDKLNTNKSMKPAYDNFSFLLKTFIHNEQKKHVFPVLVKATAHKTNQRFKNFFQYLFG